MRFAYLAVLLLSLGGTALIDRRCGLALWREPSRTATCLAAGVSVFVAWDIAGIGLGVFRRGDSPHMTGILLAPELPLEEPVFLLLLCYCALAAWRAGERLFGTPGRRPPP